MFFSFAIELAFRRATGKPIQFIARSIVPQKKFSSSASFAINFGTMGNPLRLKASPVVEQSKAGGGKVTLLESTSSGDALMTLTVAHISPIISVIAGLLILIMPRLLNLIVAIFLILNGLIGLGLLRGFH
jgi:hypothetical protein